MELDPTLQKNVRFGYYPSGHMIYLNVDALKQLKADLTQFYSDAVEQPRNNSVSHSIQWFRGKKEIVLR